MEERQRQLDALPLRQRACVSTQLTPSLSQPTPTQGLLFVVVESACSRLWPLVCGQPSFLLLQQLPSSAHARSFPLPPLLHCSLGKPSSIRRGIDRESCLVRLLDRKRGLGMRVQKGRAAKWRGERERCRLAA